MLGLPSVEQSSGPTGAGFPSPNLIVRPPSTGMNLGASAAAAAGAAATSAGRTLRRMSGSCWPGSRVSRIACSTRPIQPTPGGGSSNGSAFSSSSLGGSGAGSGGSGGGSGGGSSASSSCSPPGTSGTSRRRRSQAGAFILWNCILPMFSMLVVSPYVFLVLSSSLLRVFGAIRITEATSKDGMPRAPRLAISSSMERTVPTSRDTGSCHHEQQGRGCS